MTTINTTAAFDAGTKSQSSGNYEIETITDNPTVSANRIQLASKYGDNFTLDDADGLTFKITNQNDVGSPTCSISSNVYNVAVDLNEDTGRGAADLSGDFEAIVKVHRTSFPPNTYSAMALRFYIDDNNWLLARMFFTSAYFIGGSSKISGSTTSQNYSTSDSDIQFRIRRTGSDVYMDYDLNEGESWTNLYTRSGFPTGSGKIYMEARRQVNTGTVTGWYSEWKIPTGTIATAYFASGNWESAVQTMTAKNHLKQLIITYSGVDSNNYIDKIEFLVGGVVKATYDTNITTGTSLTITNEDLANGGSFLNVDSDFTIKIYLVGDQSTSPVITELEWDEIPFPGRACGGTSLFREMVRA